MKLRIYLDTSVFSAYYDDRAPDRKAQTVEFWAKLAEFDPTTSELTRKELEQTPDSVCKEELLKLLEGFSISPVTPEVNDLAGRYVEAGAFTPINVNDALHVATAILTRQDVLLSWNFKHLVNRRRRAKVNEVNTSIGLPTIEILAPPEL